MRLLVTLTLTVGVVVLGVATFNLLAFVNKTQPTGSTQPEVVGTNISLTDNQQAIDQHSTPLQDSFTPISLDGVGQQATRTFHLDAGGYKFMLDGGSNDYFSAWLKDESGNDVDLWAAKQVLRM